MPEHEHPILPVRTYLAVFGALMLFTLLTVSVAFLNLGPLNNLVMLGIAVVKALLVMAIFMHLKYNAKILWITAACGFVFLLILLSLTLSDVMTRGWMPNQPASWL